MPLTMPIAGRPVPPTIFPFSPEAMDVDFRALTNTFGSAVWPAANRALFYPFSVSEAALAVRLYCVNGSAVSGNVDLGIYDAAGTRLTSTGSTAQAGINLIQSIDCTDVWLLPHTIYYAAMAMDNVTGTTIRWSGAAARGIGMFQQSTAFALPATATFARDASNYVPAFGVSFVGTL